MEMKDIIKSRRTELKLTLKEVADYVGVSEATLSRWESGIITNPRRDRIAALAKILNISPSVIVGELDEIDEQEKTPALESGLDELDIQLMGIIKTLSRDQKVFLLAQLQTLQANQESSK